jgi:hypothetical protein
MQKAKMRFAAGGAKQTPGVRYGVPTSVGRRIEWSTKPDCLPKVVEPVGRTTRNVRHAHLSRRPLGERRTASVVDTRNGYRAEASGLKRRSCGQCRRWCGCAESFGLKRDETAESRQSREPLGAIVGATSLGSERPLPRGAQRPNAQGRRRPRKPADDACRPDGTWSALPHHAHTAFGSSVEPTLRGAAWGASFGNPPKRRCRRGATSVASRRRVERGEASGDTGSAPADSERRQRARGRPRVRWRTTATLERGRPTPRGGGREEPPAGDSTDGRAACFGRTSAHHQVHGPLAAR